MNTRNIPDDQPKVLIERTEKRWKVLQLIGGAAILIGIVAILISGSLADKPPQFRPGLVAAFLGGLLMSVAGIIVASVGAILAWWHHG